MRDHMDPVLGQELERVFAELGPDRAKAGRGPGAPDPRRRTLLVTSIVAIIVVIAAALAIRSARPEADPAVSPSPSPTASGVSRAALQRALPTRPYGRVVHTWTETDATRSTGPFDVTGSTVVIAAVCTGGGTISIKAPDRPAHKLGCSRLTVQQPFAKFNLGGDGKSTTETTPVRVVVSVLSGTPRYIVRMWAVDPRIMDANSWSIGTTSAAVPKSLRTCASKDLAPVGTFDRIRDTQRGVVTIRSIGTSDCAIRAWPTMQYVNPKGGTIGPVQGEDENGKSLDSSEGSLNKYGEFPPARLAAGGKAYLIVDLYAEARLKQDDAQAEARAKAARSTPSPSTGPSIPETFCKPERVGAIRLGIGDASITVPAPRSPTPAACRSDSFSFGVNPIVAKRPAGE
jgi:hypothetical protein